jgi:hypothetical protein
LLAGAGLVIGIRQRRGGIVIPIGLFIGYIVAIYVPILAQARYSVPLVPLLSVLAAITLMEVADRRDRIGDFLIQDSIPEHKEAVVHAASDARYVQIPL